MILVIIGLVIMVLGVFLFMVPMAFNKWETLIKIGFFTFAIGCVVILLGAIMYVL